MFGRPASGAGDHEPPRDAHLLAALRHAPDRDVQPPPEVTARILAAARAAVPPQRAVRTRSPRWAAWWRSPSMSAAFAVLAVATLVGLMWSTRDLPPVRAPEMTADALPVPPAPVAPVAPVAQASAVANGLGLAADASAPASTRVDRGEAQPTRLAAAPQRKEAARSGAEARPGAPMPASAAMRPWASAERAAPPTEIAPAAERRETADAAGPGAGPSADGAASQQAAAGLLARSRQASVAGASPPASIDPLARIDARLASGVGSPTWRHAGRTLPHGDAQRQWWAGMAEATRGRWTRPGSPAVAAAPWLELAVDGGPAVVFWFAPDGAIAMQAGGEVWLAPLPSSTRAQWEERVSRW